MVLKESENIHALLNAWEFSDGEAVPRDHGDLLLFLIKNCLLDQFESIAKLQKLSLSSITLPVASAYDERVFSCLKRVKSYLRSSMIGKRISYLDVISINREVVADLIIRDLENPLLQEKSRKLQQFCKTMYLYIIFYASAYLCPGEMLYLDC